MRWFDPEQLATFGRVGAVGAELVGATVLGYFGGAWLDGRLGTTWIQWVGLALGLVAGFVTFARLARRMRRELDPGSPPDRPDPPA